MVLFELCPNNNNNNKKKNKKYAEDFMTCYSQVTRTQSFVSDSVVFRTTKIQGPYFQRPD